MKYCTYLSLIESDGFEKEYEHLGNEWQKLGLSVRVLHSECYL